MKRFRAPAVALVAALLVLTAAACGGDSAAEGGNDKVTLGMPGVPPVFVSTAAYVAEEQGFFKEQGVDVVLRPLATGADVGRAVQSGGIDGGIVGTNGAIALKASGAKIKAIAGNEVPSYLVASTDKTITTCEDLDAATIAVDATGAPKDLALSVMLASCDIKRKDVKTVNAGGPQSVDAVASGQVKVAVLHPDEVAEVAKRTGSEPKVVVRSSKVDPLSHYTLLITTEAKLKGGSRDAMVSVVAALHEAIEFMKDPANLETTAKIAATMTQRDPDVTQKALEDYLKLDFWPEGDGLSQKKIEHTIEAEVTVGNVPAAKAPSYDELVDPTVFADIKD